MDFLQAELIQRQGDDGRGGLAGQAAAGSVGLADHQATELGRPPHPIDIVERHLSDRPGAACGSASSMIKMKSSSRFW